MGWNTQNGTRMFNIYDIRQLRLCRQCWSIIVQWGRLQLVDVGEDYWSLFFWFLMCPVSSSMLFFIHTSPPSLPQPLVLINTIGPPFFLFFFFLYAAAPVHLQYFPCAINISLLSEKKTSRLWESVSYFQRWGGNTPCVWKVNVRLSG